MRNLQGEVKVFEARDGGTEQDVTRRTKLLANCLAPEIIQLKKGAQVMLIKNMDETLVNGSLGKVIGFMNEATFNNYQENEEEYYAREGARESESGEASGPPGLSSQKLKMMELVGSTARMLPVVRFAIADGTTRDLLCQPEAWKVELPNGEVQASRSQIPLILAWALSIHKAQGQTLERVKVDLGRVFEKGQAYVALSRATNMAGLQVIRFDPKKVMAHETVRGFYNGLTRAEAATAGAKDVGSVKAAKARLTKAGDYERGFVEDDWEV
jgi:ATP-dependent DNA helicase PIF1